MWASKSALVSNEKTHVLHKFTAILKAGGNQIGCSRSEYDWKSPTTRKIDSRSRKFKSGLLKIGYNWCIEFNSTKKHKDNKKKTRECWKVHTPVVVKTTCLEHTHACSPSHQQLLMTESRARNFISNVSNHVLCDVCLSIKRHGHV